MSVLKLELNLPYLTNEFPGIGGKIKQEPNHFEVEEIPLYEPKGMGQHLYVSITKENKTTRQIQKELAELFNLPYHYIGHAGLKDKEAITTQSFSILLINENMSVKELENMIQQNIDVDVNWAKFHVNKLRTGHLLGNRFKITITEIDMDINEAYELARKISAKIHESGLPNFYGKQRTGEDGENIISGWQILTGKKWINDKWLRRYLIGSYQSYLCNKYLSDRFKKGLYFKMLKGDIAKKHDTGGIFWVDDLIKAQQRYEDKEISFTAPIYGYKMSEVKNDSKIFEDEIIKNANISLSQLRKNKVTGTRRIGRILPKISPEKVDEDIVLSFQLPKGSFATIVLREFMKN
jgi:tRNA pseudouridine13 synthase